MMKFGTAATLAALVLTTLPAMGNDMRKTVLQFSDLNGWEQDDHGEALQVFRTTCGLIKSDAWKSVCDTDGVTNARTFFEQNFVPVMIEDGADPLFTGYYEPELSGSRVRTETYKYPLYSPPPEMKRGEAWFTRAEIEAGQKLVGRGLEVAWLSDPVENFFLHVQGSGRIRLTDGSAMRVGFAAKNGHKYRSVGQEMGRRGLLPQHKLSAGSIKNWVRNNPRDGEKILWHNPSFIFFREITNLPENAGPIGAMNRSVTAMRTIAIDPSITTLGAPVWVEKAGKNPINRLMVAQDTGSAIKGAQRADIFYGSGSEAGKKAGVIRDSGRMIVLVPRAAIN